MNITYYQRLISSLSRISAMLPAWLEPEEHARILDKIASLQSACSAQIEEILDYDAREPDL